MASTYSCTSIARARRFQILNPLVVVTGIAVLAISQTGCRQTNGSTAAGPLQPFTSPDGTMAAPSLLPLGGGNPFGSSGSRVAPPASGAVPNNYMGGTPTANAPASNMPSTAQFAGSTNNAIGSGVTQTGWQADSMAGSPNPSSVAQTSVTFADGSSVAANPARAGGMPVIDLTNAPPPPGYHVTNGYQSAPALPYVQSVPNGSDYQTTSYPGAGDTFPAQNLVPMQSMNNSQGNQQNASPPRVRLSQNTPVLAPITNHMTPSVSQPIESGPSTRPIENNPASGDLPWQNPSRF